MRSVPTGELTRRTRIAFPIYLQASITAPTSDESYGLTFFCHRMGCAVPSPSSPVILGRAQMTTTSVVCGCFSDPVLTSIFPPQMVVTSVRDYLRKMAETTDKPSLGPRGSVQMPSPSIRDGSTVSNLLIACNITTYNVRFAKEWITNSAAGKIYRPSHFEDGHESEGVP